MSLPSTTYDPSAVPSTQQQESVEDNSTSPSRTRHPLSTPTPVNAVFPSDKLTLGAGTAIFHIASARVVLCYHPRRKLWFLPKGRKDAEESLERAAVREGWEESGYRGRLIGGNWEHTQTPPTANEGDETNLAKVKDEDGETVLHRWSTEAVFTEMKPFQPGSSVQYIVFWYIAETLPPELQAYLDAQTSSDRVYKHAEPMPHSLTIKERIAMDPDGYEPPKMAGTGVNPSELAYGSCLVEVEEAILRLRGTSGILAEVVRKGWDGIKSRELIEAHSNKSIL